MEHPGSPMTPKNVLQLATEVTSFLWYLSTVLAFDGFLAMLLVGETRCCRSVGRGLMSIPTDGLLQARRPQVASWTGQAAWLSMSFP